MIDILLEITIQSEQTALSYSGHAGTKDRSSILIDLNLRKLKARILAAIQVRKGKCL